MTGIDNKRKSEKGMTLLEALVSTAIIGIGFVAVFQMVNYSVQSIDVSGERTKASYLVSMVAEDVISEIIAICSAAQYMNTTVKAHKIPALDNNMNEASVKMMIQKGYQGLAEYMINRRK